MLINKITLLKSQKNNNNKKINFAEKLILPEKENDNSNNDSLDNSFMTNKIKEYGLLYNENNESSDSIVNENFKAIHNLSVIENDEKNNNDTVLSFNNTEEKKTNKTYKLKKSNSFKLNSIKNNQVKENKNNLSLSLFEKLLDNNYFYFPENNKYYLTSQENELKAVRIIIEENLRKNNNNYILCMIPFDKISLLNLESFYDPEQVEYFDKIKNDIITNENISGLYNIDLYKTNYKLVEDKMKIVSNEKNVQENVINFSFIKKNNLEVKMLGKTGFIPPSPKMKINFSLIPSVTILNDEIKVNFKNKESLDKKLQEEKQTSKLNKLNNFVKDYFHPKIFKSYHFLEQNKRGFHIDMNLSDLKAKNISPSNLLYSNINKDFPYEFVLSRKYKTTKKMAEIRMIERENYMIENFNKFIIDKFYPMKLKNKNFAHKSYHKNIVEKYQTTSSIDINPINSFKKHNFDFYVNIEAYNNVMEYNHELNDEEITVEDIEKKVLDTIASLKKRRETISLNNSKVNQALSFLPKFNKKII